MSKDPLHMGELPSVEELDELVGAKKKKPDSEAATLRAETNAKKEERLSKGPKMAPTPPPPPPPEVEDPQPLVDRIYRYRERFPDLKQRNKVSVKSTIEELKDELHYYETQLGGNKANMGMQVFHATMGGLEQATRYYNPLNLNLAGLSQVAKDNEDDFAPIVDELMIKYGSSFYVAPEWRLVLAVGTMVYTVHAANSGNPKVAAALAKMKQMVPDSAPDL